MALTSTDTLGDVWKDSRQVAVTDVVSVLSALPDQIVLQGKTVTRTAVFTDPGLLDVHNIMIQCEPGLAQTLELYLGAYHFSATHSYATEDAYSVTVTESYDDG